MRVLGVDPGATGAAALISSGVGGSNFPRIEIADLPQLDGHLNYRAYRRLLELWKPDVAYIENVWPRPVGSHGGGMGFVTAGRFMKGVGALEALTCCEVENVFFPTPHQWKKRFGLVGSAKNDAREMLCDLFLQAVPYLKRKKDHNRAEAGLIAVYGAERQGILNLQQV